MAGYYRLKYISPHSGPECIQKKKNVNGFEVNWTYWFQNVKAETPKIRGVTPNIRGVLMTEMWLYHKNANNFCMKSFAENPYSEYN